MEVISREGQRLFRMSLKKKKKEKTRRKIRNDGGEGEVSLSAGSSRGEREGAWQGGGIKLLEKTVETACSHLGRGRREIHASP